MPRYHFHLCSPNGAIVEDAEGSLLPDLASAREQAVQSVREMVAFRVRFEGKREDDRAFRITDGHGALLLQLSFDDALKS